jgi:hypothetical protein
VQVRHGYAHDRERARDGDETSIRSRSQGVFSDSLVSCRTGYQVRSAFPVADRPITNWRCVPSQRRRACSTSCQIGSVQRSNAAPVLVGETIELVFDPFDLTDIEVRFSGRPMGKAVPRRIGRHVHPAARPEPGPEAPKASGIDYLSLVEARRPVIDSIHLEAALALWDYATRSVDWALGDSSRNPLAEQIHAALRASPAGLTRTQIRGLFARNQPGSVIDHALAALAHAGRARYDRHATGGRPAETWSTAHPPR